MTESNMLANHKALMQIIGSDIHAVFNTGFNVNYKGNVIVSVTHLTDRHIEEMNRRGYKLRIVRHTKVYVETEWQKVAASQTVTEI